MRLLISLCVFLYACQASFSLSTPSPPEKRITGTEFYKTSAAFNWKQRDSFAVKEVLHGNLPQFLKRFVPVNLEMPDSVTGRQIKATFFAMSDYLSIGTDEDWARIPLTPMAAQLLADSFQCFIPTRKMVDVIYKAANIKLEPLPMYALRDSTPTMYHHHLMIEGQRKGRSGLLAGIKKDVVISGKVSRDSRPNRVAIYGWHKLDGKPIQPLYTGHVNWYVDYSHGVRLVYRRIKVEGKWMDYVDVLKHPVYKRLLCDEEWCDFVRYSY
jgi:hypothetical protein